MINAAWMLVILTGIAGILAIVTRRKIEFVFAPAIFAVIAVLYGFSLAGSPVMGYQAVRLLGCTAFAACAVWLLAGGEKRKYVFTPGLMVFAVTVAAAWIAHRNQCYVYQDEFSHWGRACAQLYSLQKLPNEQPGALMFPAYPPGSTLFYTFWSWLGGAFSEGSTITASNVFIVSCMLPLMQWADWKRWKRIVPLFLVCVMIPMVFYPQAYQDVYVDVLLGAVVSYALMVWFTSERNAACCVLVGGALFALPLIKASGTALALIVLLPAVMELRENPKTQWKKTAFLAFCLLSAVLSWKIYCGAHGLAGDKSFRYEEIVENIQMALAGSAPWEQQYLFQNFFRFLVMPAMMGGGNVIGLGYAAWMLVFAAIAFWLRRRNESSAAHQAAGRRIWFMMAVTWFYAIMLFHLYLYVFKPWEAAGLHSFDRYMATIMTAALAVTAALVLQALQEQPIRLMPGVLAVVMAIVMVADPIHLVDLTFAAPMHVQNTQEVRGSMCPPGYVTEYVKPGTNVIWLGNEDAHGNWLPYILTCYEFAPVRVSYPFGVIMDENVQAADVAQRLAQGTWDYVYCFGLKEETHERFAQLFEDQSQITDKTLYRIVKDGQTVKLQRLY